MRLFNSIHRKLSGYQSLSYAQENEDLILLSFFEHLPAGYRGFFVDVGAYHPRRFSNTFLFYHIGWRGINVEPNPEVQALFKRHRPRDINLCLGISDAPQNLKYYKFNEPALNTFCKETAAERQARKEYFITGELEVHAERLENVLDQYMEKNQKIDFLSVDAEGLDYAVLASNDWEKYRPAIVLAEILSVSVGEAVSHPITSLMEAKGYEFVAKTRRTAFYQDADVGFK